ncbi:MAG: ABC transporter permease [Rhabdochlamydiaceae bacterium]|nr:ABC transporter permease [Candidatus Amphrikana amoebophyrae]
MDETLFEKAIKIPNQKEGFSTPSSFTRNALIKLSQNKLAICGISVLTVLILLAIFCPIFYKTPYYSTHLDSKNLPPCREYWFGTDALGRDIFSRIWYGARITLFIGIVAAIIDMIIGVFYGAIAGYFGGKLDVFMMRIADIIYSVPKLILVILFMVVVGQGITTIIFAITITGWINMSRIVRGQIMQIKEREFVLAAQTMGGSKFHCLITHLIPNCFGPIITTVTLSIPAAIFTESFLSFLGLGVPPPAASWGTMAKEGLASFRYFPWRLFFPAAFVSITLLAFNVVGDGVRDAFDPRYER